MNDNRRQHKPHHRRLFGTTIRPREIVQGIQVVGAIVLVAIFMINVRFLAHTRSDRFLHRRHHLPGWNINGTSGQERNESQSMNRRDEQNSVPINVSIDRTDEILSIFRQPAPWRQSRVVPPWMKDYMQWHQDQRADLTAKNWNNGTFRFLVVRCSRMDTKCGGTADRLKPLPFYLLVANHLKRILCVWWEKPTSVESFLVPPSIDGIDLRLPSFLLDYEESKHRLEVQVPDLLGSRTVQAVLGYTPPDEKGPRHVNKDKIELLTKQILRMETIVTIRFQTHGHGANEYNDLRVQYPYTDPVTNATVRPLYLAKNDDDVEASFAEVFRDVWYSCFVPVQAIQQRIAEQMSIMGLHRNQFGAIHIRSRYQVPAIGERLESLCYNALHCLYELDTQKASTRPIYVSSDHRSAIWVSLQYSRALSLHHVTARDKDLILSLSQEEAMQDKTGILHLDRGSNHLARRPKDFTANQFEAHEYYDTFVDVYILSQADCITFNVGNYGKWANLLSDNRTCRISHMSRTCDASNLVHPVATDDEDEEGE